MRRITSIVLAFAFIIVSVTGVQMVVAHKNRSQITQQQRLVNHDDGKLTYTQGDIFNSREVHEWTGFLFMGAGLVHLILNKRPMLKYFQTKKYIK